MLRRDLTAMTVTPAVVRGAPGSPAAVPALTQVEDGVWEEELHRITVPINSGTPLVIADRRRWISPSGGLVPAYAHFRQSVAQGVGPGGPAALQWQEVIDDLGYFRDSNFPSRFVARRDMKLTGYCELHMTGPNVNSRLWVRLNVNGVIYPDSLGPIGSVLAGQATSATWGPRPIGVNAGQWFEFQAVTDATADRNTFVGADIRSSAIIEERVRQ